MQRVLIIGVKTEDVEKPFSFYSKINCNNFGSFVFYNQIENCNTSYNRVKLKWTINLFQNFKSSKSLDNIYETEITTLIFT